MTYSKTLLPPDRVRPPESELSDTGRFEASPIAGLNLNTGEFSQPKINPNAPKKNVFDFNPYKDYPGPNPMIGEDVRKRK